MISIARVCKLGLAYVIHQTPNVIHSHQTQLNDARQWSEPNLQQKKAKVTKSKFKLLIVRCRWASWKRSFAFDLLFVWSDVAISPLTHRGFFLTIIYHSSRCMRVMLELLSSIVEAWWTGGSCTPLSPPELRFQRWKSGWWSLPDARRCWETQNPFASIDKRRVNCHSQRRSPPLTPIKSTCSWASNLGCQFNKSLWAPLYSSALLLNLIWAMQRPTTFLFAKTLLKWLSTIDLCPRKTSNYLMGFGEMSSQQQNFTFLEIGMF